MSNQQNFETQPSQEVVSTSPNSMNQLFAENDQGTHPGEVTLLNQQFESFTINDDAFGAQKQQPVSPINQTSMQSNALTQIQVTVHPNTGFAAIPQHFVGHQNNAVSFTQFQVNHQQTADNSIQEHRITEIVDIENQIPQNDGGQVENDQVNNANFQIVNRNFEQENVNNAGHNSFSGQDIFGNQNPQQEAFTGQNSQRQNSARNLTAPAGFPAASYAQAASVQNPHHAVSYAQNLPVQNNQDARIQQQESRRVSPVSNERMQNPHDSQNFGQGPQETQNLSPIGQNVQGQSHPPNQITGNQVITENPVNNGQQAPLTENQVRHGVQSPVTQNQVRHSVQSPVTQNQVNQNPQIQVTTENRVSTPFQPQNTAVHSNNPQRSFTSAPRNAVNQPNKFLVSQFC